MPLFLLNSRFPLGERDGFVRANTGTRAAFGAFVRIDGVDVTGANSFHGAFIDARAASYAAVRNFVSHFIRVFKVCSRKSIKTKRARQYILYLLYTHGLVEKKPSVCRSGQAISAKFATGL